MVSLYLLLDYDASCTSKRNKNQKPLNEEEKHKTPESKKQCVLCKIINVFYFAFLEACVAGEDKGFYGEN